MLRRSARRQSSVPSRQGPSLLNTVARTAVISGTATATSRAVDQSINQKAMQSQQKQAAAMQSQQEIEQVKAQLAAMQTPQAPTVTPPAQPDLLTQLTQLAQLKEAGALSEEEFQLAKAKLLSS
ncbi:SHOCT domain-containing protein [Phormidesmis priestleyi]